MRFVKVILMALAVCTAPPVGAQTQCEQSARPFWATVCDAGRLQILALEMDRLSLALTENHAQPQTAWVVAGIRREAVYASLDDCVAEDDQQTCLLTGIMSYLWEMHGSDFLPDGVAEVTSDRHSLFCTPYAQALTYIRAEVSPGPVLWLQMFAQGALL